MYYTKAHHCNQHSVGVPQTIELIKTKNEKHTKNIERFLVLPL